MPLMPAYPAQDCISAPHQIDHRWRGDDIRSKACNRETSVRPTADRASPRLRRIRSQSALRLPIKQAGPAADRRQRSERSRSRPGSGRGLRLVEAIAALHHVRIELTDNDPNLDVICWRFDLSRSCQLIFPDNALTAVRLAFYAVLDPIPCFGEQANDTEKLAPAVFLIPIGGKADRLANREFGRRHRTSLPIVFTDSCGFSEA
jgi:hypothetical protein